MAASSQFKRLRLTVLTPVALTLLGHAAAFDRCAVAQTQPATGSVEFPAELTEWKLRNGNPVFTAEGSTSWDAKIRERGWILREGNTYHLWFTGYDGTRAGVKRLGYACSCDGVHWKRSPKNPLVRDHWLEDMMVVKHGDTYYMFAEGHDRNHAEMLTSKDRVNWKWEGQLDIRLADGVSPAQRPCGTPTVWVENGTWHLFYEYRDLGVWLATTRDVRSRTWTNVRDDPALVPGPPAYDSELVALNQIIKYEGAYFAFYHGSGEGEPRTWSTNIARSTDLVHWQKYAGNPLIEQNKSSGIVVPDGCRLRLYTMHGQVDLFCPRRN